MASSAFDLGAVVAHVKADISDFQRGMNQAKQEASGFGSHMQSIGKTVAELGKQAAIFTTVVGGGMALFLKDASAEANNFEKAMISLDIIASRFGVNGKKAQTSAQQLGQELRIGTSAAAEGLQNLLKSGLSLDKASDLMKRFTNEAITGKSANISLAQAVQNLSFAYATGNSALGNMSGLSENWSDITEKGREILLKKGQALSEISDEEAKYAGLIEITNLTQGSAARFTGTYIDSLAQLELQMTNLKIAIGQALNPLLNEMLLLFSSSGLSGTVQSVVVPAIQQLTAGFKVFSAWVQENQALVISFLKGLAVALGALLIIGTIAGAIFLLTNPLFLLASAVTALFVAWDQNFLGIRDITNTFFLFFQTIIMDVIIPLIEHFKAKWAMELQIMWNIASGIFQTILGLIQALMGVIMLVIAVATGVITGDWKKANEMMLKALQVFDAGAKNIWSGFVNFLAGIGGALLHRMVAPFEAAWEKIREIMNKIKDALDFTKRHSPSILDIVQRGVRLVNDAYSDLQMPVTGISGHVAPSAVGGGFSSGGSVNSINIDLSGAVISDEAGAERIAERIGDLVVKRLEMNVRF